VTEMMTKEVFLEKVRSTRSAWDQIINQLDASHLEQPALPGSWTVKDIICHLTWYEREMVGVLKTRSLTGSDLWNLPLQERNERIYAETKDAPLAAALAESRQVHAEMMLELEKLEDADLNEPARFKDMPAEWIPWELIGSNTFDHYPEHTELVRGWLDEVIG
jgi:hypothetical protein